jgi:hypothetical protein
MTMYPENTTSPNWDWLIAANLASLNEIVTELVQAGSPDPEFQRLVRDLLRDHSWALGVPFQGEAGNQDGAAARLARKVTEGAESWDR